jgi:hypothetical protein
MEIKARWLTETLRLAVPLGLALLGALVTAISAAAEPPADPHAAQPERPTVATHAGTVAPGWLEIETGLEADRFEDGSHGQSVPTVVKIGLRPRLQLSLGLPAVRPPGAGLGIGDWTAGIKWRWVEGAPIVRDLAVLPSIKVPTGSQDAGRGSGTTDASLLVISSREIGPVSLDLNLGYTRRSGDGTAAPMDATLWTISTGFPLRGTLGMAAELYGYPGTHGPAGASGIAALLGGPTLAVKPWLVFDAGVIARLTGSQPNALYAGMVWNAGMVWGGRAEHGHTPG